VRNELAIVFPPLFRSLLRFDGGDEDFDGRAVWDALPRPEGSTLANSARIRLPKDKKGIRITNNYPYLSFPFLSFPTVARFCFGLLAVLLLAFC